MSTQNTEISGLAKFNQKSPVRIQDIIWTLLVIIGTYTAWSVFYNYLDVYELRILILSAITLIWMGFFWRSAQPVTYVTAALTFLALWTYSQHGNQFAAGDTAFLLRFVLSSQSAVMWMSVLLIFATVTYFFGLIRNSEYIYKVASTLTYMSAIMGLVALLVRWRETHMVIPNYGYIPVATLYEVFILFVVMTALMYLYYEQKIKSRAMGGFVLLIITAAVIFILWYTFDRGAYQIQPLVPALKSWWMKVHVPTNFVAYGAFAIAAMVGIVYLIADRLQRTNPDSAFLARMPSFKVMDDVMYKNIALGFAFFTLATFLGALWAAEAWGGYWSWDPKETWSLILWLNYAAWLHIRMSKGWRGAPMAWWAIIGLFITTFTFLGVNMFLSGLHSYGAL